MSPLKTALIVALTSATLTLGGLFLLHRGRAREVGRLRWQNSQLRLQVMQQAAAVQSRPPAPTATAPGPSESPPAATAPAVAATPAEPKDNYRNEGRETPLAALQTFAWACDRGDTEMVGRLLHLDPGARSQAEAYLAMQPEDVRKQWTSVDEMAAALLTHQGMAVPFPGADVLATATPETISDERIVLHLPNTLRSRTEYLKTKTGWKYVITEQMAADYVRRATQDAQ